MAPSSVGFFVDCFLTSALFSFDFRVSAVVDEATSPVLPAPRDSLPRPLLWKMPERRFACCRPTKSRETILFHASIIRLFWNLRNYPQDPPKFTRYR